VLVAIDTSVLVAGTVSAHPFHARARHWLDAVHRGEIEATMCAHGLAELYGVLSRMPDGLSPAEARLVVANLPQRVRVVPLTVSAYLAGIERCAARSLKSGSIFDALHLVAAEQAQADMLLTFDQGDFTRLSAGHRPRIVVPPDPPSLQV
jgi:predicted nucleic acid-binding protein